MGGNTQMYYLNGGIDYSEIVTSLGCPPLSRPWGDNHSDDGGVCIPDGQQGWLLSSSWTSLTSKLKPQR